MKDYLLPLLDGGVGALRKALHIPFDNTTGSDNTFYKKVPLYVMATAGMRNESGQVTPAKRDIMRHVWDTIHALRRNGTSVPHIGLRVYDIGADFDEVVNDSDKDQYSFVVPAEDEGVYAWIALNHGRHQPDQMPGVMELGGKSMQIAYADPTIPVDQLVGRGRAVCLFESKYHVASYSWVLGAEKSRHAAVEEKLVRAATDLHADVIYNPCLPSFQSWGLPRGHTSTGSGDFAKCLALAESYLDTKSEGPLARLDIEPFTKRFYALSGFWYTYDFFSNVGLYDKHSAYDPKLFRKAVEQYCNGSWLNPFPWHEDGIRDNEHIHEHCFTAAWMIALFHSDKGFHMRLSNQEAWKGLIRFPSTPDLKDRSSWTIGVATMVARHGNAKTFCGDAVGGDLVDPPYHGTTIFSIPSSPVLGSSVASSAPVVIAPPTSSSLVEPAQPVRAPGIPPAVAGSLLPSLTLGALHPGSTFLEGLVCGVLLITFVWIMYWLFSTRRVAVQVPASDEKHTVDVDELPIMVRAHRAFFDKAKGTIFLAGGDNISYS